MKWSRYEDVKIKVIDLCIEADQASAEEREQLVERADAELGIGKYKVETARATDQDGNVLMRKIVATQFK